MQTVGAKYQVVAVGISAAQFYIHAVAVHVQFNHAVIEPHGNPLFDRIIER